MLKSFDGVRIGTRLKLRDDLRGETTYDNVVCTYIMATYRGAIVTVTDFCHDDSYPHYDGCVHIGSSVDINTTFKYMDINNVWLWKWSPSMFECIVDNEVQPVCLIDLLSEGGTSNADTSD